MSIKKMINREVEVKQRIKAILVDEDEENDNYEDFDELLNQLVAIKISSKTNDEIGGIYCIHITDLSNSKSIPFTLIGKRSVSKKKDSDKEERFHLIKLGKADDYKSRFNQFSFKYNVIFKSNLHTNSEKVLASIMPCNFYSGFFTDDYDNVKKASEWLGLKGSPGLKDWRIISQSALDRLKKISEEIGILNYTKMFEELCKSQVTVKDLVLTLQDGNKKKSKFADNIDVVVCE